jgi:putative ABC transport system permease protein
MSSAFFVAWCQLSYHKVKLTVAAAGVVVAVMLMLVQLGIRQGALDNSVAVARRVTADLVVVSPRTKTIFASAQFPRRLLYRVGSHPEVAAISEMYMGQGRLRNPWNKLEFPVSLYGVDPGAGMMKLPGIERFEEELRDIDRLIFDGLSRSNYGPVQEYLKTHESLDVEVNLRKVRLIDSIEVGISINTDGNLFMTPANFLRLSPDRKPGSVDLGFIRLKPGADPLKVRDAVRQYVGAEAKVMTRDELIAAEIVFIRENAPIDFIFGMGAAIGFFIGFVVVYQILYTEVTNHLPQYATLKAMGFDDRYLLYVVLNQSVILALLGYFPGFVLALGLYRIATNAIQMQFSMTVERGVSVFLLTVIMCGLSAMIAIRKVRTADPADVF